MSKVAFVFPGQGSQTVGMGKELANQHSEVMAYFEKADETLNTNLSQLIFEGPKEDLTKTFNTQPALLTTSIAILDFFRKSGIKADYVAGHSLGEYTALVAAGVLSFEEGVYAVRKRGEFMEHAVPNGEGSMAAVLGLDRDPLSAVTTEVSNEGFPVSLANLNCPGQIVISGSREGVERAGVKAKEAGAKRVLPLEVSGPFHSSLMRPAAEQLREVLDGMKMKDAEIPVVINVSAEPVSDALVIKDKLIEQLYSPVQWEDSVKKMIDLGVDTFIEIGPGKVLSGLIKKIDKTVKTYAISDEESVLAVLDALKEDKL
ncbi:[acyl-carrier-protein] S-malonyltransferase [Bacillus sp. SORGH_AS 510]|uniref:ACP S-malonyltransferase n=1 Tax=Bacillus sp. SORGH_AS_0510 TaxID=3041771 RepID=UPI00278B4171|nr:ACP S-malonyltransferase [Bacillus sp. SORGH_AS_0510]MDQ1146742.1 [acyl-carrier-protein] S-malonyltransferase [Bacillus sp. SORGH_AS_0510]